MTAQATTSTAQNIAPSRPLARLLELGRPLVMGILNVTPDSFSDGGKFIDPQHAIAQARRMVAEGADILDIGAESTRPYGGMAPVTAEEEWRRLASVLPVVVALGVPVSIDTMKAEVAAKALTAGAAIAQRRLGTAARPRHGARGGGARRPDRNHAQSRCGRCRDRYHGRHRGILRPLARDR